MTSLLIYNQFFPFFYECIQSHHKFQTQKHNFPRMSLCHILHFHKSFSKKSSFSVGLFHIVIFPVLPTRPLLDFLVQTSIAPTHPFQSKSRTFAVSALTLVCDCMLGPTLGLRHAISVNCIIDVTIERTHYISKSQSFQRCSLNIFHERHISWNENFL